MNLVFNDDGIIIILFGHSGKYDNEFSSDSSEISTIWKLHWQNAYSLIFETFGGTKMSLISVYEKASYSIVCKLELARISTFFRFLQLENAEWNIFITFCGSEISLMSRLANRRMSNSSVFSQ